MNAAVDLTGVYLETESLILRPFRTADLRDLNEYARVPGVGELAGWVHHRSLAESKEILDMFISGKKTLAIVEKKAGRVIGSVGIEPYDESSVSDTYRTLRCREIGYVLSSEYWGQGLMPEAVAGVLDFCFQELQLDAVFCACFKRNRQSRRVAEKTGFRQLCDFILPTMYGTQEDSVLLVLHRGDWQADHEQIETGEIVMSGTLCGLDCSACGSRNICGGCAATGGHPFGASCMMAACSKARGCENYGRCFEAPCRLREQLIAEFNALGIADMEQVTGLNALHGAYINLRYTLPGGQQIQFWDDDRIYLGNQIGKRDSSRCYGLTADENYLLVCEYGDNGTAAEIIVFRKRS